MTKKELIEGVAAGLRNMDTPPDYLAIIVDRFIDWEWDEDTICAIPVIKTYVSVNSGHSGLDYPVIPCFSSLEESKIFMQIVSFQKGFEDEMDCNF